MFIFLKEKGTSPVANSRNDFWLAYRIDFNTMFVTSHLLISKIENRIQNFESIENQKDYQTAIIRFNNNIPQDTLYTDKFFHDWDIYGRFFEDKSRFFEKMFGKFND